MNVKELRLLIQAPLVGCLGLMLLSACSSRSHLAQTAREGEPVPSSELSSVREILVEVERLEQSRLFPEIDSQDRGL